ncbi:YigZ family protein [Hydrogenophaga sp. PAMC20947]|uniref:IMPACT family protein n=1 Tax=Hydrogenophaga sp. PAMC20947 TaxID=2565558 RepID=UPI00109E02D2|nr:YigZ family protein [Hydrogenophaga sp. PAMC20947]QCB47070.1 YigZ family protein [Hydrogenophaga sp. PAMC20947]
MPFSLPAPVHSELTLKKSRFIGCVEPCVGREEALARVAALRAEHPSATHVCWALMAGGHSAANDDGEPGGTAGRPMLEVLRHQDLEGVLATVVRYYGGIQLGAGGLVRAYTDSVAQALLTAEKVPVIRLTTLRCMVPYALEGWLRRELDAHGAHLLDAQHGEGVEVTLSLPEANATELTSRINDASQGQVVWRKTDQGPETG